MEDASESSDKEKNWKRPNGNIPTATSCSQRDLQASKVNEPTGSIIDDNSKIQTAAINFKIQTAEANEEMSNRSTSTLVGNTS